MQAILAKARATGLRVVKSRKDNHFAVWNKIGGINLGDGTRGRCIRRCRDQDDAAPSGGVPVSR